VSDYMQSVLNGNNEQTLGKWFNVMDEGEVPNILRWLQWEYIEALLLYHMTTIEYDSVGESVIEVAVDDMLLAEAERMANEIAMKYPNRGAVDKFDIDQGIVDMANDLMLEYYPNKSLVNVIEQPIDNMVLEAILEPNSENMNFIETYLFGMYLWSIINLFFTPKTAAGSGMVKDLIEKSIKNNKSFLPKLIELIAHSSSSLNYSTFKNELFTDLSVTAEDTTPF